MKKWIFVTWVTVITVQALFAQDGINDSLIQEPILKKYEDSGSSLNYKKLIIPSALIAFGVVGLESHSVKNLNTEVKEELTENIDHKFTIDDFSQYAPFTAVYALNAFGIEGKHNLRDRTVVLGTAYLIMGTTVTLIKHTGNVERPDGSSNNSFPSGHTATAFMGAEFLFQEYKDKSVWYGIAGYAVAAGTGFFRMYNNRHWLTDISAGAGIGILSVKLAYFLQPYITKTLFGTNSSSSGRSVTALPFYNGKQAGVGMVLQF